jgi:23S rRNA (cytidine1920-2'-O)/16S rRNA (cytidine1409-2'-O)-methyltransferase
VRRRLDTELVRRGLVPSRATAQSAIDSGRVLVDGAPASKPASRVSPQQSVSLTGPARDYVSRGGEKLVGALDAFAIDPAGRRALDAGASTGGFTDCLLRRGADHVVAVDVGRAQLAWSLRNDPRVTVMERTNARTLEPQMIGGAVPLAVADLSFISLVTVAPALLRCTTSDADLVLLLKPQFEAGRSRIGAGGIVRDPTVHAAVLVEVTEKLAAADLPVVGAVPSALLGADGNREFLLHCRHEGTALTADQLAHLAVPARSSA